MYAFALEYILALISTRSYMIKVARICWSTNLWTVNP